MTEALIFYSLASLIVLNSLMVVTRRNPVSSAVFLIATLFLVAAIYAFLGADFVAVIQILIYAGAIMVLFLFVIMLLNLAPEQLESARISPVEWVVLVFSVLGFGFLAFNMSQGHVGPTSGPYNSETIFQLGGNTFVVGIQLFQNYVWPFEIASFLILLGIVASVLIAKKTKSAKAGET